MESMGGGIGSGPGNNLGDRDRRLDSAILEIRNQRTLVSSDYIKTVLGIIAFFALLYVAAVVWLFYANSRPVIEYEYVKPESEPLDEACPGEEFRFIVAAVVRRGPAVVAVIENWVHVQDPRQTYIDQAPEWRIITRPVEGEFLIISQVPSFLEPGDYTYQRALGLTTPFILELPVKIKSHDQCPPLDTSDDNGLRGPRSTPDRVPSNRSEPIPPD